MKTLFQTTIAIAAFALAGLTAGAAFAATVVDVSLWDKGAGATIPMPG